MRHQRRHVDRLIEVFGKFSGPLPLYKIVEEFEKIVQIEGINIPRKMRETVSRTLQDFCPECAGWRGQCDLFCMPRGKGKGIWAIRDEGLAEYLAILGS